MAIILARVGATLKDRPGDLPLLLKSFETIIRTAVAQKRLAPTDERAAAERIFNLVNQMSIDLGFEPPILPGPSEEGQNTP